MASRRISKASPPAPTQDNAPASGAWRLVGRQSRRWGRDEAGTARRPPRSARRGRPASRSAPWRAGRPPGDRPDRSASRSARPARRPALRPDRRRPRRQSRRSASNWAAPAPSRRHDPAAGESAQAVRSRQAAGRRERPASVATFLPGRARSGPLSDGSETGLSAGGTGRDQARRPSGQAGRAPGRRAADHGARISSIRARARPGRASMSAGTRGRGWSRTPWSEVKVPTA